MAIYTVHEPPLKAGAPAPDADRVRFVRDGFYLWALVLGPFWMLWRRLWLVAFLYIVAIALLHTAFWYFRLGDGPQFFIDAGIALLIGLEASTLERWTLARRGWKEVATVVGDDLESAERRYFAARTAQPKPEPAKPAIVSTWGPRGGPNDVVGLFPEPGGPR